MFSEPERQRPATCPHAWQRCPEPWESSACRGLTGDPATTQSRAAFSGRPGHTSIWRALVQSRKLKDLSSENQSQAEKNGRRFYIYSRADETLARGVTLPQDWVPGPAVCPGLRYRYWKPLKPEHANLSGEKIINGGGGYRNVHNFNAVLRCLRITSF